MVEVILDVFAMVPFWVGKTVGPFLQDRIGPIPEGNGKAKSALLITNPQQTIFTPAIHARTGVVMGEIGPGITIGGIVLPYSSPLTVGLIAPPQAPGGEAVIPFGDAPMFRGLKQHGGYSSSFR
jgi:hypothetical protein